MIVEKTTAVIFALFALAVYGWHAPYWGILLAAPLLACVPAMFGGSARGFVVAGTLALPYLCYALVELIAGDRPVGAVASVAIGIIFMSMLLPATRHAGQRARMK